MFDRRAFAGLMGMGGLSSLLLSRAAFAGGNGAFAGGKGLAEGLESSLLLRLPEGDGLKSALHFGVHSGNIGEIRRWVETKLPIAERRAMARNLVAIRKHYLLGQPGDPLLEIQALEGQLNAWLPTLAQGVQEIIGAGDGSPLNKAERGEDDPIDWWSLVHFLTGFFFGKIETPFRLTLFLLILWEIIEPDFWTWLTGSFDESLENQIMDVIIGMLGWFLGRLCALAFDGKTAELSTPAEAPA